MNTIKTHDQRLNEHGYVNEDHNCKLYRDEIAELRAVLEASEIRRIELLDAAKSIINGVREFYIGMFSSHLKNGSGDMLDHARSAETVDQLIRSMDEQFSAIAPSHSTDADRRDAECWRFVMRATDDEEGAEAKMLRAVSDQFNEDDVAESVQMTNAVRAAIAAIAAIKNHESKQVPAHKAACGLTGETETCPCQTATSAA